MPAQTLSLVAIGDILASKPLFPGGDPVTAGFAKVVELLRSGDAAIGTLDTPLTARGYPREKLVTLCGEPGVVAPDMARMGFDVLSVANNHTTDYGEVGLLDTIAALQGAGVRAVGGGEDLERATVPVVLELDRRRVGVLAWTSVLPTGAAAAAARPGLAPLHVHTSYEVNPYLLMEEPATAPTVRSRVDETDLAAAVDAIERLRAESDFVAALVHWGIGLGEGLAEYQRPLGIALLDAGADIVIGSHPHRILGVERHGRKAILYGAGTLLHQPNRTTTVADIEPLLSLASPDSLIARFDVAPDGTYALRLTPITHGDDGFPLPADGEAFDRIAQRVIELSLTHGTAVSVDAGELIA